MLKTHPKAQVSPERCTSQTLPPQASTLGNAGGKVKDQAERPRYTITGTEIFDGLVSFAMVCCDVNSYGLIFPDVYALIHVTDIVFCVTFPSSDADVLP